MARLEAEIHELAGEPFNLGSPKQLGDILFGKMGLPGAQEDRDRRLVDRRRACWRTSPSRASRCRARILEWRQLSKLKSTYTDALPGYVNPRTGRVHTCLLAGLDHDRAALLVRAEPAEHPGAHRGGPQDPHAPSSPTPGNKLVSADY